MKRKVKSWIVAGIVIGLVAGVVPGLAVTSAQEPPPLVIWVKASFEFDFGAVSEPFTRDTGVPVVWAPMPADDIRARIFEEVAAGVGPDIMMGSDDWLREFLEAEIVAPIALGDRASEFVPFALDAFTRGNTLYGIPFAMENLALVRNPALVPEAPKTWDDVLAISRALRDRGEAPFGFVLPAGNAYHFFPIQSAYGGYLFGQRPDGTFDVNDLGLDNDGSIAALTWLQAMVENELMPEMSGDDVVNLFREQEAAMFIAGPWELDFLESTGLPYVVSALPAGAEPSHPFIHVSAFMINRHSPEVELAHEFLVNYVANKDSMMTIFESVQRLPAHLAVFEKLEHPALLGFAAAAQTGQRFPDLAETGALWEPWSAAIQQVRNREKLPDEAIREAGLIIREVLAQQ